MQFTFPFSLELFEFIHSPAQLSTFLIHEATSNNLQHYIKYKVSSRFSKYLYARCRFCMASLRYMKNDDGVYQLTKSNRLHQHKKIRSHTSAIKDAIKELPEHLSAITVKRIVKQKYNLSDSKFYRLYNCIHNQSLDFLDFVDRFRQKGYLGYYEPLDIEENKLPTLLIITCEESRRAFQSFGDFTIFDITYNLFRQKSINMKQFRLGIFSGISASMKILPFAFVVMDDQTAESIAKIFHQLFKLLGKSPHTIISDQQASIRAGLNILRHQDIWEGQHIHDSFHLLRNIRKKLTNKSQIKYFANIISAATNNSFQYHCKEAAQNLDQTSLPILESFIEEHRQSCYSQTQQEMIGFGTCSSSNEKLSDLVKSILPRSQKLMIAANKIGRFFECMVKNNIREADMESKGLEDYFGIVELKTIRQRVCKKVFVLILKSITDSITCMVRSEGDDRMFVRDLYGEEKIIMKEDKYVCSCKYLERSGIPCQHLIKVCLLLQQPMMQYLSPRWDVYNYIQSMTRKKTKLRGPRKSRRNIMK